LEDQIKQAVEKVMGEVRGRARELKWQGKRAKRYRKVREEIGEGLAGEEGWKRVREMREGIEEGEEGGGEEEIRMEEVVQEIVIAIKEVGGRVEEEC
jgi:hypothetical protein